MTIKQKIKVFLKKSLFLKIYTHTSLRLPQKGISKYANFKDLIFYKTEKELKNKINKCFLEIKQEQESQFWKSYGG